MLRGLISRLRIKPPLGVALCFMLSVILVKSFNLVILFESNIMLIHSPTPTFNCNYINSSCKNKQKNLYFFFFLPPGFEVTFCTVTISEEPPSALLHFVFGLEGILFYDCACSSQPQYAPHPGAAARPHQPGPELLVSVR